MRAAQEGQVADFDFGLYRNVLDQALKGLRRDEGRHDQSNGVRLKQL
jgi:transcription-repair coupling factor (superfamily II helicase)